MTKTSRKKQQDVATGWDAFEDALGASLAALGEGSWQYLILSDTRTTRYVQFAVHAGSALRAEVSSNDWLDDENVLGAAEQRALAALGWKAPSPARARRSGGKRRQNHSRDFERPVDHAEVAALAVRTLRDVFQVPAPARLEYGAFERGGGEVILPGLGVARRPDVEPVPLGLQDIRLRIRDAVREVGNLPNLELEQDGSLVFRYGSTLVTVGVRGDPPYATIHGPLVRGLERREGLFERMAELAREHGVVRFFELEGDLYLAAEVHVRPFQVEHVIRTIEHLGGTANRLGPELAKAFGGRVTYQDGAQAPAEEDPVPPRLPPGPARAVRKQPVGFRPD